MKQKERDKLISAHRINKKKCCADFNPDDTSWCSRDDAEAAIPEMLAKMNDIQEVLYAEAKQALLVVIQGPDTAGKDGLIRRVFGSLNPQGVRVSNFKKPSNFEMARTYLWRAFNSCPTLGMIRIHNRSHYEDILVPSVYKTIPNKTIKQRLRQINDFERYLDENRIYVLKMYLHISRDEQKKRLEKRLSDKEKLWKFDMADLEARSKWDDYQSVYEQIFKKTSTLYAPWHIIPANVKWYRDYVVSSIVLQKMLDMNPEYPKAAEGLDKVVVPD